MVYYVSDKETKSLAFRELFHGFSHGLRTPREEIACTARPKIESQSQFFRYGRSIFCLHIGPNFSDFFDLYLHWVSVVGGHKYVTFCGEFCALNFSFF